MSRVGIEPTIPRLKRPDRNVGPDGKDSQVLAIARQNIGRRFQRQHVLAGFRKPFADSLLMLREVAVYLRVSTRTVYALCDQRREVQDEGATGRRVRTILVDR